MWSCIAGFARDICVGTCNALQSSGAPDTQPFKSEKGLGSPRSASPLRVKRRVRETRVRSSELGLPLRSRRTRRAGGLLDGLRRPRPGGRPDDAQVGQGRLGPGVGDDLSSAQRGNGIGGKGS